jgi:hypothetical protein
MKGKHCLLYLQSIIILIFNNSVNGFVPVCSSQTTRQFVSSSTTFLTKRQEGSQYDKSAHYPSLQHDSLIETKLRSSFQDEQHMIYQSGHNDDEKYLSTRRRVISKSTTRILTILATAIGVTKRFAPKKAYALEENLGGNDDVALSKDHEDRNVIEEH